MASGHWPEIFRNRSPVTQAESWFWAARREELIGEWELAAMMVSQLVLRSATEVPIAWADASLPRGPAGYRPDRAEIPDPTETKNLATVAARQVAVQAAARRCAQ